MKYGFFSSQHAARYGYTVWRTPQGDEVNVTFVGSDPEATSYNWPDKIRVGQVCSYIRSVKGLNNTIDDFIQDLQ